MKKSRRAAGMGRMTVILSIVSAVMVLAAIPAAAAHHIYIYPGTYTYLATDNVWAACPWGGSWSQDQHDSVTENSLTSVTFNSDRFSTYDMTGTIAGDGGTYFVEDSTNPNNTQPYWGLSGTALMNNGNYSITTGHTVDATYDPIVEWHEFTDPYGTSGCEYTVGSEYTPT